MQISFQFQKQNLFVESWDDYPGISVPLVGDEVAIRVIREEENREWMDCKVVKRLFYPNGDVHMVVL